MASTVTHAYFSMDLYDRLDKQKQIMLEPYKEQLRTFAQGPDVFYFYITFPLKEGKAIRDFGHFMHNQRTQSFFVNLIEYIRNKRLENDPEIIAFLYGMISHYVLDTIVHPYIVFKTGIFNRKKRHTHKYLGGHTQMETYIDAYFMKVRGKARPKHFKAYSFCFPATTISNNLSNLIDEVYKRTFNKDDMATKYLQGIKQMKTIYRLFRNDATGIKKTVYKIFKNIPMAVKADTISYNVTLDNDDYYLNLNRDYWQHPLDKNDAYNYSFIELYAIALVKATNLIKEVDKVLHRKKPPKYLYDIFPNLSYDTGRDCKLGKGTNFSF